MSDLKALADKVKRQDEERKNKKPEKNQYDFENVEVKAEGTAIILPIGMSKREGAEWLVRRDAEDDQDIAIFEEIDCFPLEGAYALSKVLQRIYGWASPIPTPGFFGDNPPTTVNIEIAYGKHAQVIWGRFVIPGVAGYLETSVARQKNRYCFKLGGKVKKRHQEDIRIIAKAVRDFVHENSIYRGKAIRVSTTDSGTFDWQSAPTFLDTSKTNEDMLIFSEEVRTQVLTHIFTPIEKTAKLRELGIKLKRSVLLEGPYGTGKTLTAHVAAKKAEENGWTFIYLDRVSGLRDALLFARSFGPAVIFAEDIDRVMDGKRDADVDDILNTIDGIDGKHDETLVILTTNEVQNIEKAMIRPGRLDAIIKVTPPDATAAIKLVRAYAGSLLSEDIDLTQAGIELNGQIPAVIAEVVQRSKMYAIATATGEEIALSAQNITDAARGMKAHLDLLNQEDEDLSEEEVLGGAFMEAMRNVFEPYKEKLDDIYAHVN